MKGPALLAATAAPSSVQGLSADMICHLCEKGDGANTPYHGKMFHLPHTRLVEARHRTLSAISSDAVSSDINRMITDAPAWRGDMAALQAASTCGQKKLIHSIIRREAEAFEEAKKFNVKERLEDDWIMPRAEFVEHRVKKGDSVEEAGRKFDDLHVEQGAEEDSTDVERVTIPNPVRVKRTRTGTSRSSGVRQGSEITDEQYQSRRKYLKGDEDDDDSDHDPPKSVGARSSIDGGKALCPATLGTSSQGQKSSAADSLSSRASKDAAKKRVPAHASANWPVVSAAASPPANAKGAQVKTDKALMCEAFDVDNMVGEDFLNARAKLTEHGETMLVKLGGGKRGIIGELKTQNSKLQARGGDADDLEHNSDELATNLERIAFSIDGVKQKLVKAKKAQLADLRV